MELAIPSLFDYIYWPITLAIVCLTAVLNQVLNWCRIIHPKWTTLLVAIVCGFVHFFTSEETDLWKVLISLSIAVIFYDYVVKVIHDKIKGKDVINPENK